MMFYVRFLIFDEVFDEVLDSQWGFYPLYIIEILILEQSHWDFDEKNIFFRKGRLTQSYNK